MRMLVTGGTGLLGSELKKICIDTVFFGKDLNITNSEKLFEKLDELNPDIILHLAALTNSIYVDENRKETVETNIIGTANIVCWCIQNNKRLVFISTDYVYDGYLKNEHKEDEALKPNNLYATSKLAGECAVNFVKNYCIIRTSFGNSTFPYESAYTNLFVSKDYVDVIAPMIYKVAISDYVGTINVGTEKKSVYIYASSRNNVKKSSLEKTKNFSLNLKKYKKLYE